MSEFSSYGTTEHVGREGPVTADALVGARAGLTNVNAIGDVGPAMFSTAPYIPPVTGPGPRGCYGKQGTCGAPAVFGTRYCLWHGEKVR